MTVIDKFDLSRKKFGRLKLIFKFAFGYSILGFPLAAGIFIPLIRLFADKTLTLPPEIAGLAMAFSSVCVVSSSLLLNRY